MRNRFPILATAFTLFCIPTFPAIGKPAATKPATTQTHLTPWAVTMPGGKLTVTVMCPTDWKQSKYPSGRPFVFKPGKSPGTVEASWDFDIKHGMHGRTIAQIVPQFAQSLAKGGKATVLEQKIVDRPDGTKAGVVEYKVDHAGSHATARDYFYALDDDSLLVASETAPTSTWKNEAPTLDMITRSIKTKTAK